jgi:hypothetical protein
MRWIRGYLKGELWLIVATVGITSWSARGTLQDRIIAGLSAGLLVFVVACILMLAVNGGLSPARLSRRERDIRRRLRKRLAERYLATVDIAKKQALRDLLGYASSAGTEAQHASIGADLSGRPSVEWAYEVRDLLAAAFGGGEAQWFMQRTTGRLGMIYDRGEMGGDAWMESRLEYIRDLMQRIDSVHILPTFDPAEWESGSSQ